MDNRKYITAGQWGLEEMKASARRMRKQPTETERIIWNILRGRNMGYKFRRQHIFDCYIVDFVCLEKQLIIEIDGEYHYTEDQQRYDHQRTEFLKLQGYREIRFDNNQILHQLDSVIETIKKELNK